MAKNKSDCCKTVYHGFECIETANFNSIIERDLFVRQLLDKRWIDRSLRDWCR